MTPEHEQQRASLEREVSWVVSRVRGGSLNPILGVDGDLEPQPDEYDIELARAAIAIVVRRCAEVAEAVPVEILALGGDFGRRGIDVRRDAAEAILALAGEG